MRATNGTSSGVWLAVLSSLCLYACAPERVTVITGTPGLAQPGSSGSTNSTGESSTIVPGPNTLAVTVNGNGATCGFPDHQTLNLPCVSVTICTPGTNQCETIGNILLDTGSWGLRLFRSELGSVAPTPEMQGQNTVAECVTYLGGNTEWGQVETVDVLLGSAPRILSLPIQVLDASFVGANANCGTEYTNSQGQQAVIPPDTGPDSGASPAGFNGILGVGLNIQDCGQQCVDNPSDPSNDPMYYTCNSTTCTPSAVQIPQQVANPIAFLNSDNNGLLLTLPPVPTNGASATLGTLVFGIGTESNNIPSKTTTYTASTGGGQNNGMFQTVFSQFGSAPIPSFLDSGSSILSFPANYSGNDTIPDCGAGGSNSHFAGLFCPAASTSWTARNEGENATAGNAPFTFGNAVNLVTGNPGNIVFSNLASNAFPVDPSTGNVVTNPAPSPYFDWGLPFFMGRPIYLGFVGQQSNVGTGPYWAY